VSSTRRLSAALAFLVLVVVGPIVAAPSAQPASRYALTAAIVEHHTVDVARYRHNLGVDHAIYEGRWRSDKAPGQPFFAAPFFALGRLVGLRPATYLRRAGDLGMWWVTLWSSMVPLAAMAVMMFLAAQRFVARRTAFIATAAFTFSTMLLPYGAQLYGHILAATLGFAAWLVADEASRDPKRRAWLVAAAGFLAGCAISVEYQTVIVAVVVGATVAIRYRRAVWRFIAGMAPPLIFTALYQWVAFGAPWHLPYHYYAGVVMGTSEGGYRVPSVGALVGVFTSSNGLVILTPLAVLALGAAVMLARKPGAVRTHAAIAIAIAIPYTVLVAGWSGTPLLEEPGPRYMVAVMPFLVVPLAVVWEEWRPIARVCAVWGALVMAAATFTYMDMGIGEPRITGYVRHVRLHEFPATLWSIAFGRAGFVLYASSAIAAAVLVAKVVRTDTNECSAELLPAANLAADEQHDRHSRRP
jgi:hypothetical protein